jgi:hypothetical protein
MGLSLLHYQRALTAVLVLPLAASHSAERHTVVMSPRAVLFYGGPLATPVVLQARAATTFFFAALVRDTSAAPDTARSTGTSPTVSVAVFWAPRPFGLPEDTLPAAAFRPLEAADQRGRLYPASRGTPALLVIDAGGGFSAARWRMTAKAAGMLAERGAPVRLLLPSRPRSRSR